MTSYPAIGIDTETKKLTGDETKEELVQSLLLIQIAIENQPVLMIDWQEVNKLRSHQDYGCAIDLLRILLRSSFLKVFHHALFDMRILSAIRIEVEYPIFDTMVASRSIRWMWKWDAKHRLKDLSWRLLGIELDKSSQQTFLDQDGDFSAEQLKYGAKDAYVLLLLEKALQPKLAAWIRTNRQCFTYVDACNYS